MANYRAQDGFFSFGGKLMATAGPLVNGALIAGAGSLNLDGTTLSGVVVVGDTFTIAGEAGAPVHTVTGGPFYVAAANAINALTFTPGIAAGGVADNAAITFTNNSVAECKAHGFQSSVELLEDTVMGDPWKTFVAGVAEWGGTIDLQLDYGDPVQKRMIDDLLIATPTPAVPGVLFGFSNKKDVYGGCLISGIEITSTTGALVMAKVSVKGSGRSGIDWN